MHYSHPRITRKIRLVQLENMSDSMNLHCGCKPGVMYLDPLYIVANDELPPHFVNLLMIGQQCHGSFNRPNTGIGFWD